MAVPKKKISVSRKKARLYSKKYVLKNYTQCSKCLSFVSLHRRCSGTCNSNSSTNIVNKYNLDFS